MIHPEISNIPSLEFSALARNKLVSGEKLYSLGLGEPFWEVPIEVRERISELALNQRFGYSNPFGNLELRKLIAKSLTEVSGHNLEFEHILITAGAKQALSVVLKTILEDGDHVIILDPSFVSYYPQVFLANHNAKVLRCPMRDDFTIDFDCVKSLISSRTKAIIVNSPNNPTGSLILHADMQRLIKLAKDVDAYLVCDEIYKDFVFSGARFYSANALRKTYEKIITIDGFSKTYGMTGWRIGYLAASPEFISKAVKIIQHEMTNIPEAIQIAACEVFLLPNNWFVQHRNVLEANAKYFEEATSGSPFLNTSPINAGMFFH